MPWSSSKTPAGKTPPGRPVSGARLPAPRQAPRPTPRAPGPAAPGERRRAGNGAAPYLLVVESDPELQQRIGEALREARYELATEAEGVWAKRSMLIRPPDAIILDTHLSDGSGFQIADALRRDPDTEKIPIFFVASRWRGAQHCTEARRRFAPAEYLPTPLDLDSLLARLLETVPPPTVQTPPMADYPLRTSAADTAQRRERREVEQEARQLAGRSTGRIRGSLARDPFARTLQRIYANGLTGALLLVRDQAKKIIYFGNGYPVSVRSNLLSECLGQILVTRRLINHEVLEESLRRMRREKRHQGEILVEMGALSPHNLQRALLAQMEAKLYEIFGWRAGSFRFSEGRDAPDQPVTLDKSPAAMILEGIRRHYDLDRQNAVLGRFAGQYIAPNEDPRQRLQSITREPAERQFIDSLDGTRRLELVLAEAPISNVEARLLLVAMAEAGMIEPSRSPVRRREGPRQPGRVPGGLNHDAETTENARRSPRKPSLPAARPPPARATEEADDAGAPERRSLEELQALYAGIKLLSHFDALGVDQEASSSDIARAYEQRAREFHPDRFRRRSEEVREVAQNIFDRLTSANKVLADPARRRRYLAKVEKERADPAPILAGHSPPAAAEQVYYTGVEYLRQRRYREAVDAFGRALALAPNQANYHGALGWALFRSAPGDPRAVAAGLAELKRAVVLGDQDPWVHVSLGRFLAETGAPDQAIGEFETALRLNPGLADVQDEIRRLRGGA
jgi:CheY-like chemotaxis protein/tetratricopeptide (TPR) repeat protein